MGGRLQWIAVVQSQVSVFTGLQRPDFLLQTKDFRGPNRTGGQSLPRRQTVSRRHGRLEQNHPRLGHIILVARLKGEWNAGRQQVSDVWIAGRAKLRQRVLVDIDIDGVIANARQWRERIAGIRLS